MPVKIVLALGLISVVLFVVLTGRSNVENFERVQAAVEEIYEDRLVVKGLIFELSTLLHRKEIATISSDAEFYADRNARVNEEIGDRLREFRATKLTPKEAEALERFESNVEVLQATEVELRLAETTELSLAERQRLAGEMANLQEDLRALSRIQLAEGKRQMSVGDKAVDEMNWIAQVENYMLIALAVMLLALIFLSPKPHSAE